MNDEAGCFVGILLFGLGLLLGAWFGAHIRHQQLCDERLRHAVTTQDTVAIYRMDSFCVEEKVK